ncbi:MAG: DEAD/DEAH box helicase [bacterium]|nr:DEAD/DEAH box helicase [bacterium]
MKFTELNLIDPIVTVLEQLNYTEPTPIQGKTIPLALDGKDVLGCAQTGSGKTAAFALPILQKLSKEKSENIRALIMTPTRELAIQICENIELYAKNLDVTTGAIYGGVYQDEQVKMLKAGVDVLVATPGRLLDLINQGFISLSDVEVFVLDEADQMLDMGFIVEIKKIVNMMPKSRQTLMFSATMPKPIERLADTILNNPETVMQDAVTSTVDTVSQSVYYVDAANKLTLLTSLIKNGDVKNAIVFTNTRQEAEVVSKHLLSCAVRARAIHGLKNQASRQDALLQFKNGKVKVLVATDIAARGLDISKLSHVFNYDIPDSEETYIHRIGRTGRAGEEGHAINLCDIDDMDNFRAIERHIGKTITMLKSEWPMTIFQKTKKVVKQTKKVEEEPAILDVKKVKDVSLNGKAFTKKKRYTPYSGKSKAEGGKNKDGKGFGGRSKDGKSKDGKSYNWKSANGKPAYGKKKSNRNEK